MADIDKYCDALDRMSKGNGNQNKHIKPVAEPVIEPVIEEQIENPALAAAGETTDTLRSFILDTIKEQVITTKQQVKNQSEKVKDTAKKIADPKQRAKKVKLIEKQEAEAIAAVDRSAEGTIQSFAEQLKAGESTKKVANVIADDDKAPLKKDVEMTIDSKFQTEMANIRKLVATSSGGGTNAVQYKDGGTMNGNLNVEGTILSGGINIDQLFGSGGGGGSSLEILDEGSTVTSTASAINFVGAGVTAVNVGAVQTVTITGLSGGSNGSDVGALSANWENTFTTVQTYSGDWLDGASTGLLSGGLLTTSGDPASGFDITSGFGNIVDHTTNPLVPSLTTVTWDASAGVIPTNLASTPATYLSIASTGYIVERTAFPTAPQRRDEIFIGVAVHSDNLTVNVVNNLPNVALDIGAQTSDVIDFLGFQSKSGNTITHQVSGLEFIKYAGVGFKGGQNFQTDSKSPHEFVMPALDPASFRYRLQDSTEYATTSTIDPGFYDLAGVRTALGGVNRASIQQVFVFPSNLVRVQYGQAPYNNFAEALDDVGTEEFVTEPNIAENGLFLGYIVLAFDATDLSDRDQARFIPSSNVGSGAGFGSTLQNAYDLSPTPEIVTDATRGAVTVKASTATIDSIQLEVENTAGDIVWSVTDSGVMSGLSAVYADGGNSIEWNSAYTTVQSNSGAWGAAGGATTYNTVSSLSASEITLTSIDGVVLVDSSAVATTVLLPSAATNNGTRYTIKKIDSSANTVTLSANTNIDSQGTFAINNQYDAIEVTSDNTQWWVI